MARTVRDPQAPTRIVEAAQRVIAEVGVKGATVRAIAAEASVSTGYVMHYFEDKQQLAAAVLRHNNMEAAARVEAARRRRRGLDALRRVFEALLPLNDDGRVVWQVWAAYWWHARGDEEAATALIAARRALAAMLVSSWREAVEDGDVRDDLDLDYEAERLATLAAGLGLFAAVEPAARVRRLATQMLDDHLASVRPSTRSLRRAAAGA